MAAPIDKARQRLREQGTEGAARFAQAFQSARGDLDKLTSKTTSALASVLRDFSRTMRNRLLFVGDPAAPITAQLVPGMISELTRAISNLRPLIAAAPGESLMDAFSLGSQVTAKALNNVNIPLAFPTVTPEILTSLTANVQDILAELVTDLGSRINTIINQASLNLETVAQATNRISDLLKTSTEVRRGLRRRIGFAFQGETIMRTEIRTIYSNAQQAASEQIAQTLPDLRKRWVTVLGERRGHLETEQDYAPGGPIGPIPIADRFRVKDFTRTGTSNFLTLGGRIRPPGFTGGQRVVRTGQAFTRRGRVIVDQMLFPRDPAADAANRVNCTCIVMEVLPEIEEALKQAQGIIGT